MRVAREVVQQVWRNSSEDTAKINKKGSRPAPLLHYKTRALNAAPTAAGCVAWARGVSALYGSNACYAFAGGEHGAILQRYFRWPECPVLQARSAEAASPVPWPAPPSVTS